MDVTERTRTVRASRLSSSTSGNSIVTCSLPPMWKMRGRARENFLAGVEVLLHRRATPLLDKRAEHEALQFGLLLKSPPYSYRALWLE